MTQLAGRFVACLSLAVLAHAGEPQFEISRYTIDGGGVMRSTGGAFELSGTIGQPDPGILSGGSFELSGGFWFALSAGDCNEDGGLNLFDYDQFESCLSGPGGVVAPGCACQDVDGSGTVDIVDFAVIQAGFSGS